FAGALTPFSGILLIIVIVACSQSVLHTPAITLLSFLYLLVRFVQSLGNAVSTFSACNASWPSFKDSLDYVAGFRSEAIAAAMVTGEKLVGRAVEREASEGGDPPAIELRSVTFAYPGSSVDVVQN
ncbi:hypothetical protein G6O46_24410, partial [Salmonella enterica subsp. enterica serovar Enteritidis]|uniref:hypothetical protein n=1 Tax=Salmonella enterica TaxID=28901 RepID=UPI0016548D6B